MEHTAQRAKLMRLSWEIQKQNKYRLTQKMNRTKGKRSLRSLALESAWTIKHTEEITVFHLFKKHRHERHPNTVLPSELSLFPTK